MDFSLVQLDAEQQRFAAEVRDVLDSIVTEDVLEFERRTGSGFNEAVHFALAARGWVMPAWPVAAGGAALDPVCRRILELELERRQTPGITAGTTALVWAAVAKYADPGLLAELEPKVAAGTVRCCLGYTEPDGGSDIAAAKVRAVRDGDEWVVNGSKIFTTGAQNCQFVFLITRTDPALPKHKGLTMFLVPLDAPGVEIQAIRTYGGERTNVVYYGDVRVADRYRLGPVNAGWSVLHGPLDAEHSVGGDSDGLSEVSIGRSFLRPLERALDAAVDWARAARRPDGSRVIDDPTVRLRLGRIATELEAACYTPGPMGRVIGAETLIRGAAALVDLVGTEGLLPHGADGAVGGGAVEVAHRFAQGTATYGGTVEVFRTIIAQHVLGLPRPSYPGSRAFLAGRRAEPTLAAQV
jgi:alkylation response protein AidB-like acyl-CoA dehydrogenase